MNSIIQEMASRYHCTLDHGSFSPQDIERLKLLLTNQYADRMNEMAYADLVTSETSREFTDALVALLKVDDQPSPRLGSSGLLAGRQKFSSTYTRTRRPAHALTQAARETNKPREHWSATTVAAGYVAHLTSTQKSRATFEGKRSMHGLSRQLTQAVEGKTVFSIPKSLQQVPINFEDGSIGDSGTLGRAISFEICNFSLPQDGKSRSKIVVALTFSSGKRRFVTLNREENGTGRHYYVGIPAIRRPYASAAANKTDKDLIWMQQLLSVALQPSDITVARL